MLYFLCLVYTVLCIIACTISLDNVGVYMHCVWCLSTGTGTFGRVVLAKHLPTRNFFALKIMTISEVIRLKQVEHVNNEKEILSSISHPFIVSV